MQNRRSIKPDLFTENTSPAITARKNAAASEKKKKKNFIFDCGVCRPATIDVCSCVWIPDICKSNNAFLLSKD